MTINFSSKTAQMGFQITVPAGLQKNSRKVKIPAIAGYRVLRTVDEGFREQKHLWKKVGNDFVLDARDLASERYLVEMAGPVDAGALQSFIYIKPATNRDNNEKADKY